MGKQLVNENNRSTPLKRYYRNRDKFLEKVTCECSCVVSRINLKQHQRSDKHLKLMKSKKSVQPSLDQ